MTIYKCDLCKKEIADGDRKVYASINRPLSGATLCETCGKPVVTFLEKNELV